MRHLTSLVLGAALLVGAVAAPAGAGTTTTALEQAADALRRDPVYVDADAERALTDAEADDLRDRIRSSGSPVFVAVLPAAAATGSADQVPLDLARATGLSGTYAVVVGDRFRAASDVVPGAGAIATAAFQSAGGRGAAAVLAAFVDDVAAAPSRGAGGGGGSSSTDGSSRSAPEGSSALPLLLLAGGGGAVLLWSSRRRRRERQEAARELAADIQVLRAELAVLSDDVLQLEPQVSLHPAARNDYEAGVQRFRAASAALDYADEPIDLVRVDRVVSEARYAMSRARAIVQGHEPPPPPVELRRPGRHDEPPIDLDERGIPVYVGGGPIYGGGWFGGGGGLFSGLLLGSMLGGWGWGGFGHHHDVFIDQGGDGFGGFGGGDWGGGDLGGGDWGGDVGGGDW